MTGVTYHGAFAQYMCADYRSVVRLPDGLSYDAAAPLACAGSTVYTAIKACALRSGQRVAISGAGALGHLGVQIAKSMGLEVVLLDARDAPLEMCRKLKLAPDVTFNSGKVDVKDEKAVQEAIKQCGGHCDAVIVTTDVIPAFTFGLELTKKHGVFVVVSSISALRTPSSDLTQDCALVTTGGATGRPDPDPVLPAHLPRHHR